MNEINKPEAQVKKSKIKYRTIMFVSFIVFALLAVSFFAAYKIRKSDDFSRYSEKGCAAYEVDLMGNYNPYYGEIETSGMEYLSNQLNGVHANLYYKLTMQQSNVEYKYTYTLKEVVEVTNVTTGISIINAETIIKEETVSSFTGSELFISENHYVNYVAHNEVITNFIDGEINLRRQNLKAAVKVVLEINLKGVCQDFEENIDKNPCVYVSIPLKTDTVYVTSASNITKGTGKIMLCKNLDNDTPFMIVSIVSLGAAILMLAAWYVVNKLSLTQEEKYTKLVNKIDSNYGSYIQTVSKPLSPSYKQVVELSKFVELLEVSNIIKQPVFIEKKTDDETVYVVPESSTRIYMFRLSKNEFVNKGKKSNQDAEVTNTPAKEEGKEPKAKAEETKAPAKPRVKKETAKKATTSDKKAEAKKPASKTTAKKAEPKKSAVAKKTIKIKQGQSAPTELNLLLGDTDTKNVINVSIGTVDNPSEEE